VVRDRAIAVSQISRLRSQIESGLIEGKIGYAPKPLDPPAEGNVLTVGPFESFVGRPRVNALNHRASICKTTE
jgi:hypothetical protein